MYRITVHALMSLTVPFLISGHMPFSPPGLEGGNRSADASLTSRGSFTAESVSTPGNPLNRLDQLHTGFTENRGQVIDQEGKRRGDIFYTANVGNALLYFTKSGMSTVFAKRPSWDDPISEATGRENPHGNELPLSIHKIHMICVGSYPGVRITHAYERPGNANFYLAHCPSGITGVKTYRQLKYQNIYPEVDLIYHAGTSGAIKYDFVVKPNADPTVIRLLFVGADEIRLDNHGDLHIATGLGVQVHRAPTAFTDEGTPVECSFLLHGDTVSLTIGSYDRGRTLVIDPWAYHVGGSATDVFKGCCSNANSDIAAVGYTNSPNYPVTNGAQQSSLSGSNDFAITVYSGSGTLSWSTYLGGAESDDALSGAFDGSGNLFVFGETSSGNFPTSQGAFQTQYGGAQDLAMVKLTSAGLLSWSTYIGGSGAEGLAISGASHIDVDTDNNVLFTQMSRSTNFPVHRALQPLLAGNQDCVVGKFSAGGQLIWATYLGGGGSGTDERGLAVSADQGGNVYCVGSTNSSTFPVIRAYQSTKCNPFRDMFITKLDSAGSMICWSTYFGGCSEDYANDVWAGPGGTCTVVGQTMSADFPTKNAWRSSFAGGYTDGVIARFDSSGGLDCSTFIGGGGSGTGGNDAISAVTGNAQGQIAVAGGTYSSSFPVQNALQSSLQGTDDGILGMLDYSVTAGYQPLWLTYFGTTASEGVADITLDPSGFLEICGSTLGDFSVPFPWFGPRASTGSDRDAFLVQMSTNGSYPVELSSLTASWSGQTVTVSWKTESESGNRGFEVQRSMTAEDGTWAARGFVQGAGTSTASRDYRFYDEITPGRSPERSIFYRLKQIDFDGTFHYSPAVETFPSFSPVSGMSFEPVVPQPAHQDIVLRFSLIEDGEIALCLSDNLGHVVSEIREPVFLRAGNHVMHVRLPQVAAGIYFLVLRGTSSTVMRKVVLN